MALKGPQNAFQKAFRWLWKALKTPFEQSSYKKNIKSLSNSKIETDSQIKALIANPFIPPTLASPNEKVYDITPFSEYLDEISFNNIHQVKLLIGQLTMRNNYKAIIDMISQFDFSKLDENDCTDLNYWLANAYLHTGNHREAENIILNNLSFSRDARLHFLLAMTYESGGRKKEAQEKYLNFIKQYPESEYKVTALIKTRMLGRP